MISEQRREDRRGEVAAVRQQRSAPSASSSDDRDVAEGSQLGPGASLHRRHPDGAGAQPLIITISPTAIAPTKASDATSASEAAAAAAAMIRPSRRASANVAKP